MGFFPVETFISYCLSTVDDVIGHFVQTAYTNLVVGHATVITLCFTLYVILLGYRFMTHTLSADITTISRHLVVLLIVYGLLMDWSLYNLFFYNIFTNEPGSIAQVMVNSSGHIHGESVAQALDGVYAQGMKAVASFLYRANWHNLRPLIYGIVVWIATFGMCIYSLVLLIFSKMVMAILLALGPLFLMFILWGATRGLFIAWLRQLIHFALLPIVVCAILALMLSVINITLAPLGDPPDQQRFFHLIPFVALSFATFMLLKRAFSICSALSSGMMLSFSPENLLPQEGRSGSRSNSGSGGDGQGSHGEDKGNEEKTEGGSNE